MADAAASTNPVKRAKQGRSPAYPSLSIEKAIDKAQALYDAEGKYAVPMPSAFRAWGYGEKSSGARLARAALRYYGLVAVEGDGETGKVRLTDDALRVLLDKREDQSERRAIIRRLALNPSIHKKLAENFPEGIKSDATAQHFLVFEEGYNDSAAGELVAEFKETATYAGLFEPANMPDKPATDEGEEVPPIGARAADPDYAAIPPSIPRGKVLRIGGGKVQLMDGERELTTGLLAKDTSFRLIVNGPVGVKEIERLIRKLELDKEILAEVDDGEEAAEE